MRRPTRSGTVWDPFVRVFHWSLVVFFALAYWLEGDWLALHSHAGYTAGLLVAFRVFWGFFGSAHARFADFVVRPGVVIAYLGHFVQRKAQAYEGHDPAGAAMILLLLATTTMTVLSGVALFAIEGRGPLAGTFVAMWPGGVMEDVHDFFANFTLTMVAVHVAGVLLASLLHRENLIRAMVTGKKRLRP